MYMPKLLIADHNDEFRQAVSQAVSGISSVRTCATGSQALEFLLHFRPDILVLDLMLPELDGISLLHRVVEQDLHPAVLATTSFHSDYVTAALTRLGVDLVLQKPCQLEAIVSHVRDLAALCAPTPLTQADLYSASANLLLSLGFSSKLDGFGYLQSAIPLYAEDPQQTITKELYSAVAKMYNKEGRLVERSIRNAIEIAWKHRDEGLWRQFFPTAPGCPVPKPSNGAFISRMAQHLAWQMEGFRTA